MKTQRLVVNQKNNTIHRIANHFPMPWAGFVLRTFLNFYRKSKLESRNIEIYKNLTGK